MKLLFSKNGIGPICLLAIIHLLVLTSCQPEPPMPVQGSFIFEITESNVQSTGNVLTMSGSDAAVWEGSLQGRSTGRFEEIRYESGRASYRERVTFAGSLDDIEGTLKIHFEGEVAARDANWEGTWEILEGEDGLENVQGSGTWLETSTFHVDYSGQIQFESNPWWQFWKAAK